jgi:hypothetical protein
MMWLNNAAISPIDGFATKAIIAGHPSVVNDERSLSAPGNRIENRRCASGGGMRMLVDVLLVVLVLKMALKHSEAVGRKRGTFVSMRCVTPRAFISSLLLDLLDLASFISLGHDVAKRGLRSLRESLNNEHLCLALPQVHVVGHRGNWGSPITDMPLSAQNCQYKNRLIGCHQISNGQSETCSARIRETTQGAAGRRVLPKVHLKKNGRGGWGRGKKIEVQHYKIHLKNSDVPSDHR